MLCKFQKCNKKASKSFLFLRCDPLKLDAYFDSQKPLTVARDAERVKVHFKIIVKDCRQSPIYVAGCQSH